MSIEVLGVLVHRNGSEISPPSGPLFDVPMIQRLAHDFDANGYDRVLILQNSFAPDPLVIATHAATVTRRLAFMVAHRPGFIAPTMAARMFATLDHISGGGRVGVHIITGANDTELQCDGDFLTKEQRYHRSAEYVRAMRAVWSSTTPVDFNGEFYRFNKALSELRPVTAAGIPIYWGGASPLAIEKAAECADVYAFGGLKPLDQMRQDVAAVQALAMKAGRTVRLQTSVRVILGETEAAAWAEARRVVDRLGEVALEQRRALERDGGAVRTGMRLDKALATTKGGTGRGELERIATGPEVLDKRLWTGITRASIDFATPTLPPALVGTAEQVADAIMDYHAMGITGFLIRGFDLLGDIETHGRELIPRLRMLAGAAKKPVGAKNS
ncbi:LLM class flavin-dependent oxidoreductase [Nitrospirillum sp. BR 11828]|uniref:LLM class flavin-dependent oxidoreductase n=1 Tax=Nitrospirillum sp. BR 11828 TaxID=3104325 RepID=UPI002ACA7A76|nr:LLM class flavin-dependent oxidoreductase [Nitrospirillum sp. BR 11828]MDZ5649737.1 LLM class flavin-dependent oxidoreductase [Nitrospirillum sp. BR 11828]